MVTLSKETLDSIQNASLAQIAIGYFWKRKCDYKSLSVGDSTAAGVRIEKNICLELIPKAEDFKQVISESPIGFENLTLEQLTSACNQAAIDQGISPPSALNQQ